MTLMLKRLLNRPEGITYRLLLDVCARYSAKVYAKVRLADVLAIESSSISDELYKFALQGHYDFVVTDSSQVPLFAVEFDGPQHDSPVQLERDSKKEELSTRFGLPLLRVGGSHLHRSELRLDDLTRLTQQWFDERDRQATTSGMRQTGEATGITGPGGSNMPSKHSCPECGHEMVEKDGKYGRFLSCGRYPACKGSCDLPLAFRPGGEYGLRRHAVSGTILIACVVLVVLVMAFMLRPHPETQNAPAPAVGQPAAPTQDVAPRPVRERVPSTDGATVKQMNLLGLLIRRRGWDDTQRDTEMEQVLGYRRRYTELSKQEASRLISTWDDRKR